MKEKYNINKAFSSIKDRIYRVKFFDASFTIEISFILPIIIFLIILIIFISFYLYDCNVIQSNTNKILADSLIMMKHKILEGEERKEIDYDKLCSGILLDGIHRNYQDEINKLRNDISNSIQGKLLFTSIENIEVEIDKIKVEVRIRLGLDFSLPIFNSYINKVEKMVICKLRNHRPEEFIRFSDFVLNFTKKN